jgi:hypothetical protein
MRDGEAAGTSAVWGATTACASDVEADLAVPVVPASELAVKVLDVELAIVATTSPVCQDRERMEGRVAVSPQF